jgi:hypothetical protein
LNFFSHPTAQTAISSSFKGTKSKLEKTLEDGNREISLRASKDVFIDIRLFLCCISFCSFPQQQQEHNNFVCFWYQYVRLILPQRHHMKKIVSNDGLGKKISVNQ